MNTTLLMSSSAIFMAAIGIGFTFLPEELISIFRRNPTSIMVLMGQLLGALYLGFAMLNWMTRENLLGGIYSRPVAVANLFHFMVGALALIKAIDSIDVLKVGLVLAYVVFAAWFGIVMFSSPVKGPRL